MMRNVTFGPQEMQGSERLIDRSDKRQFNIATSHVPLTTDVYSHECRQTRICNRVSHSLRVRVPTKSVFFHISI